MTQPTAPAVSFRESCSAFDSSAEIISEFPRISAVIWWAAVLLDVDSIFSRCLNPTGCCPGLDSIQGNAAYCFAGGVFPSVIFA